MKEVILNILREMNIEVSSLEPEAKFEDDLGMDSQELVEFRLLLAKAANKTIPTEWVQRGMSVGQLMKQLESSREA